MTAVTLTLAVLAGLVLIAGPLTLLALWLSDRLIIRRAHKQRDQDLAVYYAALEETRQRRIAQGVCRRYGHAAMTEGGWTWCGRCKWRERVRAER